jgi:F-type H+-transporting ATPase subunit a
MIPDFVVNNPLEQFEINDFLFLLAPIFGYTKLSLTNLGFYLILVVLIVLSMSLLASNYHSLIPSRWSISQESIYGSIQNLVRSSIGPSYEVYLPLVYTVFLFVLFSNLLGLVPYSFTVTSHAVMTIAFSTTILIGVTIMGFQHHGIGFFAFFIPSGTPLGLVPVLVGIELISYLSRAISLGLRLAANMIGGHVLLKIISTFTWNLVTAGPLLFLVSIIPIILLTLFGALELGIAILQAYVFSILLCSYLNDALNMH